MPQCHTQIRTKGWAGSVSDVRLGHRLPASHLGRSGKRCKNRIVTGGNLPKDARERGGGGVEDPRPTRGRVYVWIPPKETSPEMGEISGKSPFYLPRDLSGK